LLLKTAYIGFAASLIQGNTCHSSALISRRHDAVDHEVKKKLQHELLHNGAIDKERSSVPFDSVLTFWLFCGMFSSQTVFVWIDDNPLLDRSQPGWILKRRASVPWREQHGNSLT
jgi:hypothetical protein